MVGRPRREAACLRHRASRQILPAGRPAPGFGTLTPRVPRHLARGLSILVGTLASACEVTVPFYEYECSACGHRFEVLQRMSDEPVSACEKCGEESVERLLFAPAIHRERIAGMLENYDFIDEAVMAYFRRRLTQATRDADFALDYVKRHATSRELQERAIAAVRFKCDVLWAQLDALHHAYVTPGLAPPGAFRPPSGT